MLWWFYTKKLGTCDKKKLVNKIWSTKSGRAAAITPRDGVNSFMLRTKLRTFIKLLCFPSIRHFFFFCQRTKRTECQTSIMKSLTSCALLWSHPNPWRDCGLAISRLLLPPFMQKLKKKKNKKSERSILLTRSVAFYDLIRLIFLPFLFFWIVNRPLVQPLSSTSSFPNNPSSSTVSSSIFKVVSIIFNFFLVPIFQTITSNAG